MLSRKDMLSKIEILKAEFEAIQQLLKDLMCPAAHNSGGGPLKSEVISAFRCYLQSLQRVGGRLPAELVPLMKKLKGGNYGPRHIVERAIEKEQLLIWVFHCGITIKEQINNTQL